MSDLEQRKKELDKRAFEEFQRIMSMISQYNSTVERLNNLRKDYEQKAQYIDGIKYR